MEICGVGMQAKQMPNQVNQCSYRRLLWQFQERDHCSNIAVIFDPGSVYGHHEFDLAMTSMFGRLSDKFYKTYHQRIPKSHGFDTRESLYHLFHYLNHWYVQHRISHTYYLNFSSRRTMRRNHFGSGYRGQSVSIMKRLVRTRFPLV